MSRKQRGGALTDYNIVEIIGNRLPQAINFYQGAQPGALTLGQSKNADVVRKVLGANANDNDIAPEHSEYVIALAAALRELENPTASRTQRANQTGSIPDLLRNLQYSKGVPVVPYLPNDLDYVFPEAQYIASQMGPDVRANIAKYVSDVVTAYDAQALPLDRATVDKIRDAIVNDKFFKDVVEPLKTRLASIGGVSGSEDAVIADVVNYLILTNGGILKRANDTTIPNSPVLSALSGKSTLAEVVNAIGSAENPGSPYVVTPAALANAVTTNVGDKVGLLTALKQANLSPVTTLYLAALIDRADNAGSLAAIPAADLDAIRQGVNRVADIRSRINQNDWATVDNIIRASIAARNPAAAAAAAPAPVPAPVPVGAPGGLAAAAPLLGGAPAPYGQAKSNLAIGTSGPIFDLFNIMKGQASVFAPYFNLVDENGVSFELTDPQVASLDTNKARINVKKQFMYSRLAGFTGGAYPTNPNDPYLLSIFPVLQVGQRFILITPSGYALSAPSTDGDGLKEIFGTVYNSPVGSNSVQVLGQNVSIPAAVSQATYYAQDWASTTAPVVLSNVMVPGQLPVAWVENELGIREALRHYNSLWRLNPDGSFSLYDVKGNVVAKQNTDPTAICSFAPDANACMTKLSTCLAANVNNSADFAKQCTDFMTQDFTAKLNSNLTPSAIRDYVIKIDPNAALRVLNKLGFGKIPERSSQIPGYNIFKVQSVGSWLKTILGYDPNCTNKCQPIGNLPSYLGKEMTDLIKQLASDPTKRGFFNYLDALVNWVNANPSALNHELKGQPIADSGVGVYPSPSDQYRMYTLVKPDNTVDISPAFLQSCDFARMKARAAQGLGGVSAEAVYSKFTHMPVNSILAPLNQRTFGMPGAAGLGLMTGGDVLSSINEFVNNNVSQYSSGYLRAMYDTITKQLAEYSSRNGGKRMYPDDASIKKIDDTFRNLADSEDQIKKTLEDLQQRLRIYYASGRMVDTLSLSPAEFQQILDKQAKLGQATANNNRLTAGLLHYISLINDKCADLNRGLYPAAGTVLGQFSYSHPNDPASRPLIQP